MVVVSERFVMMPSAPCNHSSLPGFAQPRVLARCVAPDQAAGSPRCLAPPRFRDVAGYRGFRRGVIAAEPHCVPDHGGKLVRNPRRTSPTAG